MIFDFNLISSICISGFVFFSLKISQLQQPNKNYTLGIYFDFNLISSICMSGFVFFFFMKISLLQTKNLCSGFTSILYFSLLGFNFSQFCIFHFLILISLLHKLNFFLCSGHHLISSILFVLVSLFNENFD